MEPNVMSSQNRSTRRLQTIAALGLGLSLLAGCSSLGTDSSNSSTGQQDLSSESGDVATDLNFPQATCGESATEPRETWYVVYVDRANPDEIRRQYCNDAIGTVRRATGVPTVQVASFTDYSRALRFATAVGGEVEVTTGEQAAAGATNERDRQAQSGEGTAYLTAAEPGSSINIREQASTSAPVRQTGRAGDPIQIADQQQGNDGHVWYKITLDAGQEGWVRSDFVTRNAPGANTASTSTAGGSGNASSNAQARSQFDQTETESPRTYASPNAGTYSSTNGYTTNPSPNASGYASTDRTSSPSGSSSSYPDTGSARDNANRNETNRYETSTSSSYADSSTEPTATDAAILTANDPGAVINIRDDASTASSVLHTGYAGDPIQITDVTQGEDGYTWYYVEFDSGVSGWVRGDFVD